MVFEELSGRLSPNGRFSCDDLIGVKSQALFHFRIPPISAAKGQFNEEHVQNAQVLRVLTSFETFCHVVLRMHVVVALFLVVKPITVHMLESRFVFFRNNVIELTQNSFERRWSFEESINGTVDASFWVFCGRL